eukprot:Lithocolla_globosa_v1_NODE_2364_length_2027_cov_77.436805.p1 type:complete len:631 gc:universal NODE_2364_length_2027_cov_77.436805:1977-85(-)
MRYSWGQAILLAVTLFQFTSAFYIPGAGAHNYHYGNNVPLQVGSLRSHKTALPMDYYLPEFNFCGQRRKFNMTKIRPGLASTLSGTRLRNSVFEIKMGVDQTCAKVCDEKSLDNSQVNFMIEKIQQEYNHYWFMDGLPGGQLVTEDDKVYAMKGFPLGVADALAKNNKEASPTLNNHQHILVKYHVPGAKEPVPFNPNDNTTVYRVIQVIIYGASGAYENGQCTDKPVVLHPNQPTSVTYTYSISWEWSDTPWAGRWDKYLHVSDPKIHWVSLINSTLVVVFLTAMVAMVLLKTLHRDIARYNSRDLTEEADETGWKLCHGDVFRSPSHPHLLSVAVGNGLHILIMSSILITLGFLGFMAPSQEFGSACLLFYVVFSFVPGYVSAVLYKSFGGENWKMNVALSCFLLQGICFLLLFFLNFFLVGKKSAAAVPFWSFIAVLALWLFVAAPVNAIGAYFGFVKRARLEYPVRTNQIPRSIPPLTLFLHAIPSSFIGGVLPFGAVFIEFYFIMNGIWFDDLYYVFGFLFFVFLILIVTCSEVSILMCYFHLCAEDYRWWWRAFFAAGCSAFYMFIYGLLYYYTKLSEFDAVSTILYLGAMFGMSLLFFLFCGSIGFLACFWFVRKIFASIKTD